MAARPLLPPARRLEGEGLVSLIRRWGHCRAVRHQGGFLAGQAGAPGGPWRRHRAVGEGAVDLDVTGDDGWVANETDRGSVGQRVVVRAGEPERRVGELELEGIARSPKA